MPDVEGRIVLGLDISNTTQQISQDLNNVLNSIGKKEITLSAKIDNIDLGNTASQIKNVTGRISQEFNSTLNVIDLVNGRIGHLKNMLQGAGFSKSSMAAVTQDLQTMNLQISKISTTMSQNGNIQLRISGTDQLQRAVTVVRQYDAETGKVANTSKTFVQSFQETTKAATSFSNKLEQVQSAIASNKIEAAIAGITTKFETLSSTGHEKIALIEADLKTLNSLQQTLSTSKDSNELVSTYDNYQQILERVRNNLTIVADATKFHAAANAESKKSADDFAKSLENVQNALATNKIDSSIASVTSKFNQLSSTGHERLGQIQTDIEKLNSLQQIMSTSSDSQVLVGSFNEYTQVLARVKNNLSLVSVETKSLAQEQNTLARSMTLSSKMDSWMNQNVKAVEKYGAQIKALQSSLNNNKNAATLTNVSAEFSKIQSQAKAAGLTTNQFAQSLKNTALQVAGLGSAIAVINKIASLVREAINTVVELDTALVDLQKTTTMSGSQMAQFYKDANIAAKELGVTTKDIIQSAADWSRMGYSDKTSSEMMARLSAQFAAISPGADINQATTGLLSTMKAYGIEVGDVLDGIMSKINIVGNTAGTSNAEILTGLSKSAAAMAAMNSSLDENIALFTAAQEIVQNDSQVGNAIRSISLRVRGYDEETEQLSEELANISGEVVDLTKTVQHAEGVSLFTDETQEHYKSVYKYLQDISKIYDELSEKQQQQLMEKLFGKNRSNVGQAILKNFKAAEDAMNNMANSAGNADAEMEVIKNSLEFKLNALRETSVGIFQDMFPREDIGAAVDALTGLLNIIGQITSFLGPMGTALAGAGIFAFVKNLD